MRDGNTVDMAGATKRVPLLDLPMRDGNQDRLWVVRGSDCQATSGIDPFATRRIDPPRVVGLRFGRHLLGFPDQARASFFKKPVTLSTDHHYRAVVQ